MEVKNRLEKEKKAIKKKQNSSQKDNRSVKHQARPEEKLEILTGQGNMKTTLMMMMI